MDDPTNNDWGGLRDRRDFKQPEPQGDPNDWCQCSCCKAHEARLVEVEAERDRLRISEQQARTGKALAESQQDAMEARAERLQEQLSIAEDESGAWEAMSEEQQARAEQAVSRLAQMMKVEGSPLRDELDALGRGGRRRDALAGRRAHRDWRPQAKVSMMTVSSPLRDDQEMSTETVAALDDLHRAADHLLEGGSPTATSSPPTDHRWNRDNEHEAHHCVSCGVRWSSESEHMACPGGRPQASPELRALAREAVKAKGTADPDLEHAATVANIMDGFEPESAALTGEDVAKALEGNEP